MASGDVVVVDVQEHDVTGSDGGVRYQGSFHVGVMDAARWRSFKAAAKSAGMSLEAWLARRIAQGK